MAPGVFAVTARQVRDSARWKRLREQLFRHASVCAICSYPFGLAGVCRRVRRSITSCLLKLPPSVDLWRRAGGERRGPGVDYPGPIPNGVSLGGAEVPLAVAGVTAVAYPIVLVAVLATVPRVAGFAEDVADSVVDVVDTTFFGACDCGVDAAERDCYGSGGDEVAKPA
jgi:hypothetical protein